MADNRRNTSVLLLVFALMGLIIFYGCGGGGGSSSDPLPTASIPTYHISGQVTSSDIIASILLPTSAAIRAASDMSGIEVYLESNRAQYNTTTASDGRFLLNVPQGTHRIVAIVPASKSLTGKIYKVRSGQITVSDINPTGNASTLSLRPAEAVLTGILRDASGNLITNAKVMVWGEETMVDGQGKYQVYMPDNTVAAVQIMANGFQSTSLNVNFDNDNPQVTELTMVTTAATNRAPIASLTAAAYKIEPNLVVNLNGSAFDPDGDALTYSFSTSSGTVTHTDPSSPKATFMAPANVIATVSMTVTDPSGLRAVAQVRIEVGRGGTIADNTPPVITLVTPNVTELQSGLNHDFVVFATDAQNDFLNYTWSVDGKATLNPSNASATVLSIQSVSANSSLTLRVLVSDAKSTPASWTKQFTVLADPNFDNDAPVAQIASPSAGETFKIFTQVSFIASATDNNPPLTYKWEIQNPGSTTYYIAAETRTFYRTFNVGGTYNLRLTVTDNNLKATQVNSTFVINANEPPALQIVQPALNAVFGPGESVNFVASATDPHTPLTYKWEIRHTASASYETIGTTISLAKTLVQTGTYMVRLTVADSYGVSASTVSQFSLTNSAPALQIVKPTLNQIFISGQSIDFVASATDPHVPLTYKWELKHNASATYETIGTASSTSKALGQAGVYQLILTVTDHYGLSATTNTQFSVNDKPVASIVSPANAAVFQKNDVVSFTGSATDPDGDPSDLTLKWTFPGGVVKTGTAVTHNSFNPGSNTVQLSAYDTSNESGGTATVEIYLNSTPTITSVTPASGTVYQPGETINFAIVAADVDTSQTSQTLTYEWASGSTILSTQPSFSLAASSLGAGIHDIKVTVSDGTTGTGNATDSTFRIVVNQPPVMTIVSPNQAFYALGSTLTFTGQGQSTQGLTIPDIKMNWAESFNNATSPLAFNQNNIPKIYNQPNQIGTYTVTLSATDEFNVEGKTSFSFYINATPTITLNSPASGTRFDTNSAVNFQVTAQDPGDLTPTIRWYDGAYDPVSNPTPIFTGMSNSYSSLTSGVHTIFCYATDSAGYQSVASTGVFINTLPTGNISITSSNGQYATGPANVPVFLSTNFIPPLSFNVTSNDVEIGGPIENYNSDHIKWYLYLGSSYVNVATGTNFTKEFNPGSYTVKVELYDSFYPGMPATQTRTIITKSFNVWQFRSNYPVFFNNVSYIDGKGNSLLITRATDTPGNDPELKAYDYQTDLGDFVPANPPTYWTATGTGSVAGTWFENDVRAVLYRDGATTLKIGRFIIATNSQEIVSSVSVELVPLVENIDTATSITFSGGSPKLAYAGLNGKVIGFNNKLGGSTFVSLGAPEYTFGSNLRVRTAPDNKVFFTDPDNNRVFKTLPGFGTPIQYAANAPKDIAFSTTYFFTISNTDSKISLFEQSTGTKLMEFGGDSTVGTGAGYFDSPIIGIYSSGADLFILENDGEMKVIRSGVSDWLSGSRMWAAY